MSQRHPIQNEHVMLVTIVTKDRFSLFSKEPYALEAVEALYKTQSLYSFLLFGFVIMPDHCHFLLKVPEPQKISTIIKSYKLSVSFSISKGSVWQPRFHLRIAKDPWAALRYIHQNPMKKKLVSREKDYRWSSASGLWDTTPLPGVMESLNIAHR